MAGVVHRREPQLESNRIMYREKLGFGSSQARASSWSAIPASAAARSECGVARYSLIRSVTQEPSRDNGLGAYGRSECLSACTVDPDRCYASTVAAQQLPPKGADRLGSENWTRPKLRSTARHPLRAGHGLPGDRCPAAALSNPTSCSYLPTVSDAISDGSPKGSISVRNGMDRPCSSTRMRDIWKMPFVPLDAAAKSQLTPSSVFSAAPSTTNRDAFLTQQYTRTQILMRPSSGDSQRHAQYLPVTYMHDMTSPATDAKFRRFGDVATFNAAMHPRPSSCTYKVDRSGVTSAGSRETDQSSLLPRSGLSSAQLYRPGSKRACRCGSSSDLSSTRALSTSPVGRHPSDES